LNRSQSVALTRQRVFGSFSSARSRLRCRSFERWNQNFSTSAPSSVSIFSKRTISAIDWASIALPILP
jgi:hypothetical protein